MKIISSRLAIRLLRNVLPALMVAGAFASASAQEKPGPAAGRLPQESADATVRDRYCASIADAAAEARIAWQTRTLADLEAQIEARIAQLKAERAKYEVWLRRREEFLKKAEESVVAIYSRMSPDAAAPQLAVLEDETAASVLARLKPRNAGAILSEMDPRRAAQLTAFIAGAHGSAGETASR